MRSPRPGTVPPPPSALNAQLTRSQRWATLPEEPRRQTLQTLRRIVAPQLHIPRSPQEVAPEDGGDTCHRCIESLAPFACSPSP